MIPKNGVLRLVPASGTTTYHAQQSQNVVTPLAGARRQSAESQGANDDNIQDATEHT